MTTNGEPSHNAFASALERLRTGVTDLMTGIGWRAALEFRARLHSYSFLYQPLLWLDSKVVDIGPAPLNEGDRLFVEDLRAFADEHNDYFHEKELYLLFNLSRGKGVGFFEIGTFHPVLILWLLADGKQNVIFVGPKGIRNLGPRDPKIQVGTPP